MTVVCLSCHARMKEAEAKLQEAREDLEECRRLLRCANAALQDAIDLEADKGPFQTPTERRLRLFYTEDQLP